MTPVSNSDSNDPTSTRAAKAHDLCCVGTALIDYLSTGDFELIASLGIEPGAMTLIDGVTAAAVREAVGGGQMASGGTVANTAAGVASLGGHPVFVGAVAGDDLGERYASDLEENGIRAVLELLPAMDGGSTGTGTCYVIVTPDSQRTMATTLGVSGQLHARRDRRLRPSVTRRSSTSTATSSTSPSPTRSSSGSSELARGVGDQGGAAASPTRSSSTGTSIA